MTVPADHRDLRTRIADDLREKISNGDLQAGDQLPTIGELAAQYHCSPLLARSAVDLLKQQGLVTGKRGAGTFVRQRPVARRWDAERYSRSVWMSGTPILTAEAARQGLTADQTMRFLGEVPAPPVVAIRLAVDDGSPVLVRKRITRIDGRPNQMADSYYPPEISAAVPRLREENTGPGGGFARVEEAGYHLADISEEIAIRMPTTDESVTLELPEGTPVADLIRTVYTDTGQPIEVMLAILAGDMTTFYRRFPIPE